MAWSVRYAPTRICLPKSVQTVSMLLLVLLYLCDVAVWYCAYPYLPRYARVGTGYDASVPYGPTALGRY